MGRRALAGLLVSLAVFLLFAEIGAVVLFAVKHGQFFYTRSTSTEPHATIPAAVTNVRIAPYFGFMWAPGIEASQIVTLARLRDLATPVEAPAWFHARTNNYGFLSPRDYPFAPTDSRAFVIGIFGGSVAQWFALQGSAPLADALRASPAYRDRDIVVLSFASGGYKQPQQMLVLDYFFVRGQRLDYVINIDGFNEVGLGGINATSGIDAAMPSAQHMLPLARLAPLNADGNSLERLAEVSAAKRRIAALEAGRERRVFAVAYLVDEARQSFLERRVQTLAAAFGEPLAEPSLVSLLPATQGDAGRTDSLELDIWQRASIHMHGVLSARGIGYLHVIQPNQYFGKRTFTAGEAKIALNDASPYRAHVERGYPALLARVPALRTSGVTVLDATALFDREPAAIYADDCCHYNQLGNDILARAIADVLTGASPRDSR